MNKTFHLLPACISMLLAVSCTKTDTIAPPELSQSRLLEYKIVNVQGSPIAGSISEADSSITVYLPAYLQLITLEPQLKVSEGATVTPASGTLVEDLLDVFQKGRDIRYTVTGKNGSKKTYTLHINVQQAPIVLTELSTADNIRNFNVRATATNFRITQKGTGFNEVRSMMRVALVDDAGTEYNLPLSTFALEDVFTLSLTVVRSTPEGAAILNFTGSKNYKIRVYNYALQTTSQFPIKITQT